jgi:hypothetical protein
MGWSFLFALSSGVENYTTLWSGLWLYRNRAVWFCTSLAGCFELLLVPWGARFLWYCLNIVLPVAMMSKRERNDSCCCIGFVITACFVLPSMIVECDDC